jgi:hypothetical protein
MIRPQIVGNGVFAAWRPTAPLVDLLDAHWTRWASALRPPRRPRAEALIGAAAAHGGIAVLHRDAYFDRLTEVLASESVESAASSCPPQDPGLRMYV